jgi:hypothetical protein
MKHTQPTYPRILAIAPGTRGFGFALFEGQNTLAHWGVKSAKGDKNAVCIMRLEELITHYEPGVMVLQDMSAKGSKHSARIRTLSKKMISLAALRKIKVALFTRDQVMRVLFADEEGTKHALAEIIADRFPEEFSFPLPPKRRSYLSEDPRMGIFDAVALALMFRLRNKKRTSPQ